MLGGGGAVQEGESQAAGQSRAVGRLGEMRTRREELIFVEGLLRAFPSQGAHANTENGNNSSDPAAWGLGPGETWARHTPIIPVFTKSQKFTFPCDITGP